MLTKTGNALKLFKSPTIYWKKKKKKKGKNYALACLVSEFENCCLKFFKIFWNTCEWKSMLKCV